MNSYSFAQFSTLLSRVVEAFIMKRQVKNSSIGIDLDGYSGDEWGHTPYRVPGEEAIRRGPFQSGGTPAMQYQGSTDSFSAVIEGILSHRYFQEARWFVPETRCLYLVRFTPILFPVWAAPCLEKGPGGVVLYSTACTLAIEIRPLVQIPWYRWLRQPLNHAIRGIYITPGNNRTTSRCGDGKQVTIFGFSWLKTCISHYT